MIPEYGTDDAALTAYDRDFHAWAREQAHLLRTGRIAEADLDHLAEEIESMGRSEKRELISRLAVLLTHLLKWQFQPSLRSRSWELTIREQRRKLDRHLLDNPSLRAVLPQAIADGYGDALLAAQRESGLDESTFPPICPYLEASIFEEGFLPT